jgi:hypothetical protein
MKLYSITLLGLTGLVPLAGFAASVTYTTALTTLNNDSDTVFTLNKFDTSLGVLTGVNVSFYQSLSGVVVQMDNDDVSANTGSAKVINVVGSFTSSLGSTSLLGPAFTSIVDSSALTVNQSQNFVLSATSGDAVGAFNNTGASDYASWSPGTISRGGAGNVNDLFKGLYSQAGGGTFTLTSNNSYLTSATFSGPNGYFQGNTPSANGQAIVTYTYTPTAIPEPSAYAVLLGFGTLAGSMYMRRRQSR